MKYFVPFYLLFVCWAIQAQSLDEAQEQYARGNYKKALPILEAIVQSTSKKFAVAKPEAYRALGHIYYLSYQFEKSADAYRQVRTADAAPLLDRSERAARMLSHCENIQLIDSIVIDKESFLDAYLLSRESGRLKNENGRVTYENPRQNKRYFAETPAGDKKQGSRLYVELKMQSEWQDRREIQLPTALSENNDYPFVLSDGLTLYFASDNQFSIGGYDLFITRYNPDKDTWLTPSQMGMPFNSIANDYLLAIDEEFLIGYFATDRFQPEGKVTVYTFVPNEEIIPLKTTDRQILADRAKITSIRDTWLPQADYRTLLNNIREIVQNRMEKRTPDFQFIIDDETIYHTLNDFRSDAAKQTFLKRQEMKTVIQQTEQEIDSLRLEYAKAESIKRQSYAAGIISKETHLKKLYSEVEQLEKDIRNLEIRIIQREVNHKY
jgi:hypothetical protein